MAVFSKKNETFILCIFVVMVILQAAYSFSAYYLYIMTDMVESDLEIVYSRETAYHILVVCLSMFYVFSIGYRSKVSLDAGWFYLWFYIFLFPYAIIKHKGWLKGLILIFLWIIALYVPDWAWSAAWTWAYWGYE